MIIRPFVEADSDNVIALWHACDLVRPWNDPQKDIQRKRQVGPDFFLVGEQDGRIIGTVMGGYDGHRGWINYLAIHPDQQRSGLARQLMVAVEARLLAAGCPKINLQIRETNLDVIRFYEDVGYTQDRVVSFGKRLIPDQ